MKVRCIKKAYHKGKIWREGEVYDYPEGETPPDNAFVILKDKKDVEAAQKTTRAARLEEAEKNLEKDKLVTRAVELGVGAPSTLSRWGVEKLKEEIKKAEEGED